MPRAALCLTVLLSLCGIEAGRCQAQQPAGVVYLNQSRNWRLFDGGRVSVRPLIREIVRQAFLLAARDELGLETRDAWLGDAMPIGGDNPSWDVVAALREPLIVEIVRGSPAKQTEFTRHEIGSRIRKNFYIETRRLTELEETLSRTKFVEGLKKAGFQGQRNARDEKIAVPGKVEALLGEMNFLSQFQAVRELHGIIRSKGESSALVGGLVRGYANLGVMTEFYWHPAHKVFKARALLYAQRMVARDDKSPLARWHRAYAAALAGIHDWALADLNQANTLWRVMGEKTRPPQPAWSQLIGPLCHYEIKTLDQRGGDPQVGQLAALLKFLAVDQAGGVNWAVQTAIETVKVIPECYRVHDTLCEFGGVSLGHAATIEPVKLVGEKLYGRLASMPGLPAEVRRIVKEPPASGGGLLSALFGGGQSDFTGEFDTRRKLTDALLRTGQPPAAKAEDAADKQGAAGKQALADAGEPSWATLGLLIRELSFMQVYRRVQFERHMLSVPSEHWLAAAAPLVQNHPYKAFLDTYAWTSDKKKEALSRLAKVDPAGCDLRSYGLCSAFDRGAAPPKFYDEFLRNEDYVVRDFVTMIRFFVSFNREETKWLSQTLLYFSPDSPLARTMLVRFDWDGIQAKLKEWDKASAPYPKLSLTFGERYLELGRWDDAERCFKAAVKVAPSDKDCYEQLAWLYKRRGQLDRWVATLEEYLKQPDYGLGHFAVQSEIAGHFMWHKEWEKALPYAKGAADSYSSWGLLCAADCQEGLQHWDEAEKHNRACSERYRSHSLRWYFFCRRTGEGNLEEARRLAQAFVKNLAQLFPSEVNRTDLVAFYLLEGDSDKALPQLEQALAKEINIYDVLWLALIADRLKDAQKRDAALNRVKILSVKKDEAAAAPQGVSGLVDLIQKDLAQGGKGHVDLEAADKLAARLEGVDRFAFHFLLAEYLNRHGQRENADRYWRQCMGWPNVAVPYRTFAGAMLVEHNVKPADYKALLQQPTADGGKPERDAPPPKQSKPEKKEAKGSRSPPP